MSLMNPSKSLILCNMDSATKKKPKSEIGVYFTKFPNVQIEKNSSGSGTVTGHVRIKKEDIDELRS